VEFGSPNYEFVAFFGRHVDCHVLRFRQPQPSRLNVQHLLQLNVIQIHVNRSTRSPLEFLGAPDMVDVRMRDHNRLNLQTVTVNDFEHLRDIVSGIHHQPLPAFFVAKHRAVALQHAHRQNLVDHKRSILNRMIDVPKGIVLWLHLACVVLLIGGALYGRLALKAAAATMPQESADKFGDAAAGRYRGWVLLSIVLLVLTGIYNYLHTGAHSTRYHILLGIKLLLVLHIFASTLISTRPENPRRLRQLAGAGLSGLLAILIAVYMSQIA
jgi:uncharacterized membrane protein